MFNLTCKLFRLGALFASLAVVAQSSFANAIVANKVDVDVSKVTVNEAVWSAAKESSVSLMAQPMIAPRPQKTETSVIKVKAVYDGNWIAFKLRWADPEKSEAGPLGKFSDGVAVQFPVNDGTVPPIFMGAKGMPVHILHWRAQYERDKKHGKPEMKDLYPNMNIDMYPMEFRDHGKLAKIDDSARETYSHGRAAGNPQSFPKHGVDEIIAEGFGSTAVVENIVTKSDADWKAKEWSVVLARPMKSHDGLSAFEAGKKTVMAFAVWQGGKDEVGSRKSVTMTWIPLEIALKQ